MGDTVASVEESGREERGIQAGSEGFRAEVLGVRYEVEWDEDANVTPVGPMVFLAQYLGAGGLMDRLCEGVPLRYRSPNAPKVRDVLGTAVLSVLQGHSRYAHASQLRNDRVGARLLGMTRVVSEDSLRRAFGRGEEAEWDAWLRKQERAVWEPLLAEPYVLDIDSSVKPLYGHQEGAEAGYNPKKPGRPSHNLHTYFIGSLRLVLGVDVRAGKEHAGGHGMEGLWRILDGLPAACRPDLLRGDIGFGNEKVMVQAEERDQAYLFRLRRTARIRGLLADLERASGMWSDAGDGWEGCEARLRLDKWSRERRCVALRRPASRDGRAAAKGADAEAQPGLGLAEVVASGPDYEYTVLVTGGTDLPLESLGGLYRDRADCENVFDEIKNQWGWGGYTTRDLQRCRITARLVALVYNWWNIFARLARPDRHLEAVTSRPMLLQAVGRLVRTGRRNILRLTSTHARAGDIRLALSRIGRFLHDLGNTAEQLSPERRWAAILTAAFMKWLRGKPLAPLSEADQWLLPLLTG